MFIQYSTFTSIYAEARTLLWQISRSSGRIFQYIPPLGSVLLQYIPSLGCVLLHYSTLTICTPYKTHSLQRSRGGAHTDHKRGGSFNLKFSNALSMQKEINVEVYGVVLALYTLHNLEQLQELFLKSVSHIPNAMLNSKSISLNLSHHMPPVC